MTMISEYFARVGADVDEKSLKKVDDYLAKIEGKLKKFNPSVKLTTAMGASPMALTSTAKKTDLVTKALDKNNKVQAEGLMLSDKALKAGKAVSRERAKEAAAASKENAKAIKEAKALQTAEEKKAKVKRDARNAKRRASYAAKEADKKAAKAASLAAENEAKKQARYAAIRASQAAKMAKANLVGARVASLVRADSVPNAGANWYQRSPEVLRRFGALTPEERVAAKARQADNNKRFRSNLKNIIPTNSPNAGASWYQNNPEILRRFGVPSKEEKEAEKARVRQELASSKSRQMDNDRRFKENLRNLNPVPEMSQTARNRLQRDYENNPDIIKAFGKKQRERKVSPREIESRRRKTLLANSGVMGGTGSARNLFAAESLARAERNRATMQAQREERRRLSVLGRNKPPITASQSAKNRVSYFSREAAITAGVSGSDRDAFIAREMASREGMLRTTKRQTAEYQRQHNIVRRTVALLDRQSRGAMGAVIGSRAATSARYESNEIRRLQGLVARQQTETKELRDRLNSITQRVASNNSQGLGRASRNQRNNYLAMGGGFGAMSRYGMASLPFIGGAMGFSALNRSSQEHATAPLTVQAAFEAQGRTSEEGMASWEWYKKNQTHMGVSYMDSAQDFTGFMSNAMGSGLDIGESQEIFKGFSEYMTAMGLNSYRRKLVTNALTQTLGKGVVSMEELRRQMAESMAGTMPAAAKAFDLLQGKDTQGIQQGILEMGDADSRQEAANIYARMNNMSGKTDQEKMAAMMKAVASGQVESAPFMKMMAAILSYQAQPKLDAMRKMSFSAEGRFGSKKSDLMMTANAAGLDPALAKVWDNLTNTLREFQPLIPTLVSGFDKLTTAAEMPARTLKGLNNIVGDLANTFGTTKGEMAGFILTSTTVGGMLATKWGRVALAVGMVALVVEDLVTYFGKTENTDTLIGSLIDSLGLDRTDEFQSKVGDIVAVVGGLTTVLAAYALARGKLPKWALPSAKTATTAAGGAPTAAAGGAAAGGLPAAGAAANTWSKLLGFANTGLSFIARILKIGVVITAAFDIVFSTVEDGLKGFTDSVLDQAPLLMMAFGGWTTALIGALWQGSKIAKDIYDDYDVSQQSPEFHEQVKRTEMLRLRVRGNSEEELERNYQMALYNRDVKGRGLEGYDLLSAHKNEASNTSWTIPKIEINITSADGSPEEVASTLRSTIDDVVNNIISGVKAQYITP